MPQAFFFGDVAHNFAEVSAPFVAAAGGPNARIALLLQGGEGAERFVPAYRDPWLQLGAGEVIPIYPAGGDELPEFTVEELRRCTGIFVGGGWTRRYHKLYAASAVGRVIRERYLAGVPYGGVSAGAMIAAKSAMIDDDELILGEGIGLLDNVIIGAHVDQDGNLPRLVAALERSGVRYGLGIPEPACVEVSDGREARVHGEGQAYLLRRLGQVGRFELRLVEVGERFELG